MRTVTSSASKALAPAFLFICLFAPAAATAYSTDQVSALSALNYYRSMAGLSDARLNESLCDAAQNHARYRMANLNIRESPHNETPGLPGYTGAEPHYRMRAAGYRGASYGECISMGLSAGGDSVDALVRVPYHRILFMQGDQLDIGIAVKRASGRPAIWVFDMSGSQNETSVWPPADSRNVPLGGVLNESPDPLAVHGLRGRPVGYVLTMSFDDPNVRYAGAKLERTDGKLVALYVNHSGNDPMCRRSVLLIPESPLAPNTTYKATIKLESPDGDIVEKTWSFKTGTPASNFEKQRRPAPAG